MDNDSGSIFGACKRSKTGNDTMKSTIRSFIAVAVFASPLAVVPQVASADTFTPLPGPPSVAITASPTAASLGESAGIQPADPASTVVYNVTARVTTNATLAALDTVTMCFYKGTEITDDAFCPTDPKNGVLLTWTESEAGNVFDKAGTNQYALGTGDNVSTAKVGAEYTDPYSRAAQSVELKFNFKVSSAALAGTDWNVLVTAAYDSTFYVNWPGYQDAEGSAKVTSGITVKYYANVSGRTAAGFESVAEGGTSFVDNISAGTYKANAESDFSLTGTDFTSSGDTLALGSGSAGSEAGKDVVRSDGKKVALDCALGASLAVRLVKDTAVPMGGTLATTDEDGDDQQEMSCTLRYGSGAATALTQYSNTVTISINPK